MKLAFVVCAVALLAVCAAPLAAAEPDLEWVQPAFVETLSASFPGEPSIDPSLLAVGAQVDMSAMTDAQADAYHMALLEQTVTAEGKSKAELQAEIAARGPSMWENFKKAFGKRYTDEAAKYRTFLANLAQIAIANTRAALSRVPARLRVVHSHMVYHADKSRAEFRALLGLKPSIRRLPLASPAPKRKLLRPGGQLASVSFLETEVELSADADADAEAEAEAEVDADAEADAELEAELEALADMEAELDMEADAEAETEAEAEAEAEAEVEADTASGVQPIDCDFRQFSTPIKNQGSCGSCWSFSAISTLETVYRLHTNRDPGVLSTQQLVDCVPGAGTKKCDGGQPSDGLMWLTANGGAVSEASYPYKAVGGACGPKASNGVKPRAAKFAVPHCLKAPCRVDEVELGHQLSSSGTLSANIDASTLQFYRSGVIDPSGGCSSDPAKMNHAVNIEGLGTDRSSGQRYWIMRNSWGPNWGEAGRFRLAFAQNTCGIGSWVVKVEM